MSYCLNPVCPRPPNPDEAKFCRACGQSLLLGDRYRALRLISQGGFGKTFLAQDEADVRKPRCVIKQSLAPAQTGFTQQQTGDLFRQEAARLKQLGQHPQIPRLLDHIEQEEEQYLIQEFIDGRNLEEELTDTGAFNEPRIRQVLLEVLPVLKYIHRHQVIHRDIKPENIIAPALGGALVLVDFGASKYVTATTPAKTGTVIGSAAYVAPEQAMGKAEFASDLYSLGVTCIHLLTALHPFDLYSISADAWVWQDYLPQPVSQSLGSVLDTMLQRATRQRYRTAAEILRDLTRLPAATLALPNRSLAASPRRSALRQPQQSPRRQPILPWELAQTLTGHESAITAIAIHPQGHLIASGSRDKTIKLWDLPTGQLIHTFAGRSLWFGGGHSDTIRTLAFSAEGDLISGGDDNELKVWDLNAQKLVQTLPGQGWVISAIATSVERHQLAIGSGDGAIQLWDLQQGKWVDSFTQHQDCISGLVMSPDGLRLASSSHDKTIRLWDLRTHRLINTLKAHADKISAIAITPDWQNLVSASWDKTIRIWNLVEGEPRRTLAAHRDRIHCLAVHPKVRLFASGSEDNTVHLWDLITGDRLFTLRHSWGVNALAFSPNGEWLVSGSADETIKIWRRQPR